MFNNTINRWWSVVAGGLGCAAGSGVVSSFVFGLYIKAISAEYGWGRSITTSSFLCFYVACGIGCVSLGHIMARWGVRRAALLFTVLFALSLIAVGLVPRSLPLFCVAFAAVGFFGSAASALPYAVAIAAWFDKGRGTALALAVSGTGVSAALIPYYANWLMSKYGWRGGYIGVGVFCGIVSVIGLTLFFRMPANYEAHRSPGLGNWRGIIAASSFWKIALPVFLISIAMMGIINNLASILTDRGSGLADAAALMGLAGAASWISRLLVGVLLDRIHVRFVSAAIFSLVAVGVGCILAGEVGMGAKIAAVSIGLGIGSEADLIAYAVSRYFDHEDLSGALGSTWLFWTWGGAIGALIGSASFDISGSYAAALVIYLLLSCLSALLILRLGAYSEQAPHADEPLNVRPVLSSGSQAG
jgi:MFS family permease